MFPNTPHIKTSYMVKGKHTQSLENTGGMYWKK